jgi:chemotaxis response regulator CheB
MSRQAVRHLLVWGTAHTAVMHVHRWTRQENFLPRPSSYPMFRRSLAKLYGSSFSRSCSQAMGKMALKGSARGPLQMEGKVLRAGPRNERRVGMPGAWSPEGLAARVLPLKEIGLEIAAHMKEGEPRRRIDYAFF